MTPAEALKVLLQVPMTARELERWRRSRRGPRVNCSCTVLAECMRTVSLWMWGEGVRVDGQEGQNRREEIHDADRLVCHHRPLSISIAQSTPHSPLPTTYSCRLSMERT